MSPPSDTPDLAALSGLDQLRLMLDGRLPPAPIAGTVGFHLTELAEGRVAFEGEPTLAVYNPIGSVHGGWMATLLDSACGCAVHSMLKPGQAYTTLELKTVFHKALKAGVPVRAEGRIVQSGRRAAFSEADLRGLDGTLYATATSTCLVMERA
ncbi:PaaI family thioesterase [Brevundimonas pondensis]|uniref:PaaI family thioesterase n=1 Tax=Brevundimonas pondensis TaxID=2774189 RepID=A0ABX7SKM9_9CAUL|nr:PaaI family thioesterase [Brevundimonas pondensis]QTC87003.1 PaaI family thioesterase [Brevundimonas pondensis]